MNHLFPHIFDVKVLSRELQQRMKHIKVDLKSMFRSLENPKLLQKYNNIKFKGLEFYMKEENSH